MSWAEIVQKSFRLWWATLSSVLVFSFVSALLKNWGYFFHLQGQTIFPPWYLWAGAGVAIINLIPTNAVFARISHVLHNVPISLSQSLAVALLKFPKTAVWLILVMAVSYLPLSLLSYVIDHFSHTVVAVSVGIFLAYMMILVTIGVYCIFVFPLIINENYSVSNAVRKSIELVKGEWWLTGWVLSTPVFFAIILQIMLRFFLGQMGEVIGFTLFMSLNVATILVLYEYHVSRSGQISRQ